MKFYRSIQGLARSLAALSVCIGIVASPCIHVDAKPSAQRQSESSQSESRVASAVASASGVLLQWRGACDPNNLGFNVYRVSGNSSVRANRELIPGAVFSATRALRNSSDCSYSYFDREGTAASSYQIESVSVDGIVERDNSLVSAKQGTALDTELNSSSNTNVARAENNSFSKTTPAAEQSILPKPNGQLEDQFYVASRLGLKISIKKDGWYRVTQPEMAAAGFNPTIDIRNLRLFTEGRELAINTSQAIGTFGSSDYIEFYGRGLDVPTSDSRTYYLIADTTPGKRIKGELQLDTSSAAPVVTPTVPELPPVSRSSWFGFVWTFLNLRSEVTTKREAAKKTGPDVATESDPLTARKQSASEPGLVTFSPATSARHSEAAPAAPTKPAGKKRTKKEKKKSRIRRLNHPEIASALAPANFAVTAEHKDRFLYFANVLNGDAENFFGFVLSRPTIPITETISVPNVDLSASGTARLEIALQGVNQVPHQVAIQVNNVPTGTISFFGGEHTVQFFDLPLSQLQGGSLAIKFTASVSGDVSLIDYARVTYPHAFQADSGALRFNLRGTQARQIDGFTTANVRLIDYTNPYAVTLIKPATQPSASGYAITVPTSSPRSKSQRLLYAIPEGQFEQPAALALNQPATLNAATNAADFVLIAHKNVMPALTPLVNARQAQGMKVLTADIEDVYDEFGYGLHGPQAIKEFLSYATTHWTTPPRYVIFAGDASYDPRNYMGIGDFDLVPTKLVDATYNETASDDWLADFDNDGIANIAIGRLPVRTVAEANLVISKIVGFTPANVPQSALLIADQDPDGSFGFVEASDSIQNLLTPAGLNVQRVTRAPQFSSVTTQTDSEARANIINGFNAGKAIVNYSGHGNVDVWTGASLFTATDATALTNGNKLSFVVVMDCLNGYYTDPNLQSLSEALLMAPNGGAVAAFASSGLTVAAGQHQMSQQLYTLLYGPQSIALGDAIKTAKAATTDIDVRRTWIYFGDPSLKIR